MKATVSPRDQISAICARILEIEHLNARTDACVRMHDLKEKGRSFETLEGAAFEELLKIERDRLEAARPLVKRVMKKFREQVHGAALAQGLGDHYRQCIGERLHDVELPKPKKIKGGYHPTTADSESFWKFLQGGAPGLIQQK